MVNLAINLPRGKVVLTSSWRRACQEHWLKCRVEKPRAEDSRVEYWGGWAKVSGARFKVANSIPYRKNDTSFLEENVCNRNNLEIRRMKYIAAIETFNIFLSSICVVYKQFWVNFCNVRPFLPFPLLCFYIELAKFWDNTLHKKSSLIAQDWRLFLSVYWNNRERTLDFSVTFFVFFWM